MSENRLANETSPYLLQHKDNPVHWWPWGPEALAEARKTNKPILLSIGYAACHWCHVMAHESFEDQDVADVMNALFVNIKVDREERPDVDNIYMMALHMLGAPGGWPLTMFLTPAGEPFWGGTYFPKHSQFGRPGFIEVLHHVNNVFTDHPDKVEQNRSGLVAGLQRAAAGSDPGRLSPAIVAETAGQILAAMDSVHGGLQGAPKFPQTQALELLWRVARSSGDVRMAGAVLLALDRMCSGGIYDHLGGGFARYSVDARWLVPHFEKMLYDNALLLDLMIMVHSETPTDLFRQRIEETIGWLVREMRVEEGGFCSSLDADSDGEEGAFYVWREEEIRDLLSAEEFTLFAGLYDVTPHGNWEDKIILNRLADPQPGTEPDEAALSAIREKLWARRETRNRPGLDDKILADWNGLAIHALARAAFLFDRPEWLDLARQAFNFVSESMADDTRLRHAWRAGQARHPGLLSDHANMIRAAITLFELTGETPFLQAAESWSEILETRFLTGEGAYFMAPDDATDLIVRPRSAQDDATPNGNAVSAANQLRLWLLTGKTAYRDRAEAIFAAFSSDISRHPPSFCGLLTAFDLARNAINVVVITKPGASGGETAGFLDVLRTVSPANLILTRLTAPNGLPPGHPAHGKGLKGNRDTAYVCTTSACSLPVTEPEELRVLIEKSMTAPQDQQNPPAQGD